MGIAPSEFWAMSATDKAYLLAYKRVTGTIQAYEAHLNEKKSRKKQGNK